MPTHPPRACPVCRRLSCTDATHQKRIDDWRARRARRPYNHAERTYKAEQVKAWVLEHGWVCPGDEYHAPHTSRDLTFDHEMPVSLGGDPLGPGRVVCRSANSRRGNGRRGSKSA